METSPTSSGIKKYLPILNWLPDYPKAWLRFDMPAGLGTTAVVIPQSMAYAGLAGLPVEVGLYAALTPMLAYVLLDSATGQTYGMIHWFFKLKESIFWIKLIVQSEGDEKCKMLT